ncbi:MAG: flagellar cap protein FliD N-terminal domain-containing protein, partial [Anaerolineales bacterium]
MNQLDSYFVNLIHSLMTIERQPLTRLEEQRNKLNVTLGVYQDSRSRLLELQNAVYALRSDNYTSALKESRSVSARKISLQQFSIWGFFRASVGKNIENQADFAL